MRKGEERMQLKKDRADAAVESLGIYVHQRIGKSSMLEMHDHAYFEIYFLEKGEREYFIGDRFYKVKETEYDRFVDTQQQYHKVYTKA